MGSSNCDYMCVYAILSRCITKRLSCSRFHKENSPLIYSQGLFSKTDETTVCFGALEVDENYDTIGEKVWNEISIEW